MAERKQHRCGRCNEVFLCKHGPFCKAGAVVMPNIVNRDGTLTEHCPLSPDWAWIRGYGDRMRAQGHIEAVRVFSQVAASASYYASLADRVHREAFAECTLAEEVEAALRAAASLIEPAPAPERSE